MSTASISGIPWAEAAEVAKDLCGQLAPVAHRVKTVGSVRRRKPMVRDIEILIEPRIVRLELFGYPTHDVDAIRTVASQAGTLIKSGDRYIQVAATAIAGLRVDLFLCYPPAHWGSLLAIRTGPADLSRHAVTMLAERGYRHRAGHVETAGGQIVPTPTEEDFFRLAGLACLPPRQRHTRAAFQEVKP